MNNFNKDLLEAVKQNNISEVQRLIPLSDPTCDKSFALRTAANLGHFQCVDLLIPISSIEDRTQALQAAVCGGFYKCVELLIPVSNPKGNSSGALLIAAMRGDEECVKRLAPVSGPQTTLWSAMQLRDIKCLKILVDATDFSSLENYETALMVYTASENFEHLKVVVEKFHCKEQYNVALKMAAGWERPKIMEYLYPLSDPWEVLNQLKIEEPNNIQAHVGLEQMIAEKTAVAQNAVLQVCVENLCISAPTKDRKI